jgi:hypothetical protein
MSIINESQTFRKKLSSAKSDKRFWNTFNLRNFYSYIKLITIAFKRWMQRRRVQKLRSEFIFEVCLTAHVKD